MLKLLLTARIRRNSEDSASCDQVGSPDQATLFCYVYTSYKIPRTSISYMIKPVPSVPGASLLVSSVGDRDRDRLRKDRSSPRLFGWKIMKSRRRSRSLIEIECGVDLDL